MKIQMSRGLQIAITLAALFAGTILPVNAAPAAAQEKPLPLTVTQTDAGVRIDYTATNGALPTIQIHDVRTPGRLVLVEIGAGVTMSAMQAGAQQNLVVQSAPFGGQLDVVQPAATEASETAAAGDLQRAPDATLPAAPVSVISEGIMRGRRLATIAITPLFEQDGQLHLASAFSALLPGAKLIDNPTSLVSDFTDALSAGKLQPQVEDAVTCDNSYLPANDMLADGQARWRIRVSQSGIVHVTAAALSAAGVPPSAIAGYSLKNSRGESVSLQRGPDWFRFYAPPPGDRWNRYDTYWLTVNSAGPSAEMGQSGAPGGGVAATIAFERGVYVSNKYYDSTLPGSDGDHWFAANLRPYGSISVTWSFMPSTRLPATGANATVQVGFASSTSGDHTVQLATNGNSNFVNPANSTSGIGAYFTATFSIPNFAGVTQFRAMPKSQPEVIMPDRVVWEQPVALNFGGGGATFLVKSAGNVQLSGMPGDALYDVTNATTPTVVQHSAGLFSNVSGNRSYVMAGTGTLVTNAAISKYEPVAMNTKFNKNAVYIAPNALFTGDLDGFIGFRNVSGYLAGAFSAESIYDWWSFGQVSPAALRNFLRYAYCKWDVKPAAVTMIGDGSIDPFDYYGYNTGQFAGSNVTLIPPYAAPVDPFLVPNPLPPAETACEACYAQLDGNDPLSDKLPDLLFGRIPAKSPAELNAVLAKLFAYETAPSLSAGSDWRSRIAYVNDNSHMPNGATDPAGDFAAGTEANIAQQPSWARIIRNYYDPYQGFTTLNPNDAHARTFGLFDSGVGIINYTGHGSVVQMAVLESNIAGAATYHFSLYDVPDLRNTSQLPLLLQFTCLTSAFQTPIQYYGTTIDERLLLSPNGPPAIWGPTSLAVSFSHEALMKGFYKTLWAQPSFGSTIGLAAQGGYLELEATSSNTINVDNLLRTYLIMGDPLTRAYVGKMPWYSNAPIATRAK